MPCTPSARRPATRTATAPADWAPSASKPNTRTAGPPSESAIPEKESPKRYALEYSNPSSPPSSWAKAPGKVCPWHGSSSTSTAAISGLRASLAKEPRFFCVCPWGRKATGKKVGSAMSKCLLLVDDEPLVLSGLRRSLRSMLDEWTMECAVGGEAALEAMARHPFDVVVTDMRMPGMDGAQLLNEVRRRSPQTVRVALSGQCDRKTIMSAIGSTHQYLSKPCDARELEATINHAMALRNRLHTPSVTKIVSQLKTIPSLPAAYHEMMAEL